MKFNHKIIILLIAAFSFSACEDYLGGDINTDPNRPTSVPVFAQMPQIQITLADVYGGLFSRFNCMLVQQVEGVARQWQSFNQYTGLTPNRFDSPWTDIYENIINEIKTAQRTVQADGNLHYEGVLNIMEAFSLMIATDVWDDMPYTDAFAGIESINPVFDSQADIYNNIYNLLDSGLSLLNGPSGTLVPGNDDVFFGGDIESWKKVANAIKARGYLKDRKDYAGALALAKESLTSAADNLTFEYPDVNAAGPWYRFNLGRTGDVEFHPTMRGIMEGFNDTVRLSVMDNVFDPSHPYMTANFLQELITFREIQFIIAETDFRVNGGTEEGHTAYLAGIKASFERLGLDDAAYEAYIAQPEVDPGVGNLTLELIMTQKYIALWLDPEVYSDWRRTNIPALTPVSGASIPVRWHYSANEYLFNMNAPDESTVDIYNDRVGWNK